MTYYIGIDPASGRGTSNIAISLWYVDADRKHYAKFIFAKQYYLEDTGKHPDLQNIDTVSYIIRSFFSELMTLGLYESFIRTTRKVCIEDVPSMIFKRGGGATMTKEYLHLHQVRSLLIYAFIAQNSAYWLNMKCEQSYVQVIPITPKDWQSVWKECVPPEREYEEIKSDVNDAILIAFSQILKDGIVPDPKHLNTFSLIKSLHIEYPRLFAFRREVLFPKSNRYEPAFKMAVAEDIKKLLGVSLSLDEIIFDKRAKKRQPPLIKKKKYI